MRLPFPVIALLLTGAVACGTESDPPADAGTNITTDAGTDAGTTDAGELDAGTADAGEIDAGTTDAGATDAGEEPFVSAPDVAGEKLMPGFFGTCWLRADATLACTGEQVGTLPGQFAGTYVDVSTNQSGLPCAVKSDGSLQCVVPEGATTNATPTGTGFRRVSAPGSHFCAINAARGLQCWTYAGREGDDAVAETPTTGEAVDVAGAHGYACAAFKDGSAKCWGALDHDFGTNRWVRVFAYGGAGACAIRDNGTAACHDGRIPFPNDKVKKLAGNFSGLCGLRTDNTIVCKYPELPAPAGQFTDLQNGYRNACGRRAGTGVVECFGPPNLDFPAATSFVGVPTMVLVTSGGVVTRSAAGETWSSRSNTTAFTALPANVGTLTSVSASGANACGLNAAGAVTCWGGGVAEADLPNSTTFKTIDPSPAGGCGLDTSDHVKCWGHSAAVAAPTDAFAQVCATLEGGCARRADGTVTCWGDLPQPAASDRFTSISCETSVGCGVRVDGSIACWVDAGVGCARCNALAADAPTTGTWADVVLGGDVGCARATDGAVTCWGDARARVPPAGSFEKLWVAQATACGLRTGGAKFQCWGNVGYESQ